MRLAERILVGVSKLFFAVTALALFLLAAGLVAVAVQETWSAVPSAESLPHLLRGIGASETVGSDLISYLAFDSLYAQRLLALGYRDAHAARSEIETFFEVPPVDVPA